MHCIKPLACSFLLAIVLAAPQAVQAGSSSGPTDSKEDVNDVYSDWEVWIAEPMTVYVVKVQYLNGHTETEWFDTAEEAVEFAAYMDSKSGVYNVVIVEHTGPGPWEFLNTFDTRADAQAAAAKAASFGFYTSIERISAFESTVP